MVKRKQIHVCARSHLRGVITIPGDKSISHRALMLGAIAEGKTVIRGLLRGADNLATLEIMRALGVEIDMVDDRVVIHGVGLHGLTAPKKLLRCGNAGTAMRLLTGLLSGQDFDSVLVGDASLSQRPMRRVLDPLALMGASIESQSGCAPLAVKGGQRLSGIKYTSPVASAQVKSCLLLAGLYAKGMTEVVEPALTRDHTERMLAAFGAHIERNGKQTRLHPGKALKGQHINVPGDISSAAFFMVAATIVPNSHLILKRVGVNPTRLGVIEILQEMGADISLHHQREEGGEPVADIEIRSAHLKGIRIPKKHIVSAIDEFPVLFIAAACAKGKTSLRNAKELRVKETDRIAAMATGLKACGIRVDTVDDGIDIEGGHLQGATIDSFDDHRIAMAFAVAGCLCSSPMVIQRCENVATSFPNFIELARQVGFHVST